MAGSANNPRQAVMPQGAMQWNGPTGGAIPTNRTTLPVGSPTPVTPSPTAGNVNPAATNNIYSQAAQAYTGALGGTLASAAAPNVQQFMNPYTQEVINRTRSDLVSAQQQAMNQLGAQAQAAGAFGGSRHGVAEALTNQGFIDQLANTSAQLRQQGYGQALGAAQNLQQQRLAAAGQLGNLSQQGLNMGQSITQQQSQQGALQQAINQRLIDAARQQYLGFTGAPQQSIGLPLQAVGAANMGQQTQTQTMQPGLFNYLSAGLSLLPF